MNITILNGNSDMHNQEFDRYLDLYKVKMHNTGHYVRSFMLRDMKILDLRLEDSINIIDNKEITDDFRYILNSLDETDLLIIASPLEQGFLTVLTKTILDRLTKVLQPSQNKPSPWLAGKTGMAGIPLMGMVMQKEEDTNEQDLLLNKLSGERIAANIHTVLDFCITTDTGVSDAVCKTFQSIDYNSYIEKTYTDLIAGSAYSGN
jgi:multimeric flavodoxin WrbA